MNGYLVLGKEFEDSIDECQRCLHQKIQSPRNL